MTCSLVSPKRRPLLTTSRTTLESSTNRSYENDIKVNFSTYKRSPTLLSIKDVERFASNCSVICRQHASLRCFKVYWMGAVLTARLFSARQDLMVVNCSGVNPMNPRTPTTELSAILDTDSTSAYLSL